MKRILAFTLIFAMLFTAMLGIMPTAEGEPAKLEITHANLEFASNVYLLVAVDYTGVCADEAEALEKVYITVGDDKVTADAKLTADEETPDGCVAFKYTNISAKEIGDIYEIAAFVDGEAEAQDTTTYSILEYAIKTKAEKPGTKLATAVAAMLAFGAAAQDAFDYEGDYALADENGAIDYGMVVFSGAAENKKTIAKVGTTVNVPAAAESFTAAAALYDMSFDAVEGSTVSVANGFSRYFYYEDFISTVNSVTGSLANLDLDKWITSSARQTYDFKSTSGSARYGGSIDMRYYTEDDVVKTAGEVYGFNHTYATIATNQIRHWGFVTFLGSNGSYSQSAEVATNGNASASMALGHLFVDVTGDNIVTLSNQYAGPDDMLINGETKMTVSVSMAVADANATNKTSAFYINGHASNVTSTSYNRICLFEIVGDDLMFNGTSIATLKDITAGTDATAIDAGDFTTVHFVLDNVKDTVTVYTADGRTAELSFTYKDTTVTAMKAISWAIYDSAYINRITVSQGSLFD